MTVQPAVGTGATICGWTDRHAATIVKVSPNGKRVTVQLDDWKRTDDNGMSESQTYLFTPNPDGPTRQFSYREKRDRWVEVGSENGNTLYIGGRNKYHDFSF